MPNPLELPGVLRTPYPRASAMPARLTAGLVVVALLMLLPSQAAALRVVTYNVLNFPGSTGTAREGDFRTVVQGLDADVIVVQEMLSAAGASQFLNDILNYGGTGEYAMAPFIDGPDTDNTLFYRVATVNFLSQQMILTSLRNIAEYRVRPIGYSSSDADFRVYSVHLKAGSSSSDQSQRLAETTILRNRMNSFPEGKSFMVAGDYNIRSSTESCYQKLVGSEANDNGRVFDPLDAPGTWHDNAGFAWLHTQSPRTESFGGGATGGMDDRFDLLLTSYALADGEGMDYIDGSYVSYGNDGYHFNTAINAGTNYAVGSVVADALHAAADHLPVYADFDVPAKIDAPVALDFGSAIVGSYVVRELSVSDVATPPADELDYEFSAPAGFGAPSGVFEVQPGETLDHEITMDTSAAGPQSGTLVVMTDDPDHPTWGVSLTGSVVEHAVPSLSDSSVVLEGALDFGTHDESEFDAVPLDVYNLGYSELQALLDVSDAEIVGGDGRFGFTGGFVPAMAGASPASFSLEFDGAGATEDSLYTATLTLRTRDDTAVQGSNDLDSLVVSLAATVSNGSSVPEDGLGRFALSMASGNPFSDRAVLSLRMPVGGAARVRVFDVRGRLVRTLVAGRLSAGDHPLTWDGRDRDGRLCPSGVYLIRADNGAEADSRKLVLLR
jgi:endonuclease/exonuclease/phosphatase family metal-dependent hydrolase